MSRIYHIEPYGLDIDLDKLVAVGDIHAEYKSHPEAWFELYFQFTQPVRITYYFKIDEDWFFDGVLGHWMCCDVEGNNVHFHSVERKQLRPVAQMHQVRDKIIEEWKN